MTQLIVGLILVGLIVIYFYLRNSNKHQEANLPAVSEDINLPAVSKVELPTQNDGLEGNRPQ